MRLLSIIKKYIWNIFKKDFILKTSNDFLKKSILQSIKEIPSFNYLEWKIKYKEDLFYFLFEQIFRGSSIDIKNWQKVYIGYVKEAYAYNKDKIWLDIGCGRGEFLVLLKEQDINCLGIDTNSVNINICLNKNLNAIKEDAVDYLKKIPDNSLSGISALQVIEHFNREFLKEFLLLCYNKISDKGKLILETVNIRNNLALRNYFNDPTHNLPLMPEFLEMYLEFLGFKDVFVLYLSHNFCFFKKNISNYPDYAIIATK